MLLEEFIHSHSGPKAEETPDLFGAEQLRPVAVSHQTLERRAREILPLRPEASSDLFGQLECNGCGHIGILYAIERA